MRDKIKNKSIIYVFFIYYIFSTFTLLPIQDAFLYSKIVPNPSHINFLFICFAINFIIIFLNSFTALKIKKNILFTISILLGFVYLYLLKEFSTTLYFSPERFVRIMMSVLAFYYLTQSLKIREIIKQME